MKSVPLLPSSLPNARVEDLGESELLTGNVEVRGLMIEMWCHVEYVETYHGGTLGKHVDMYHDSIYDRCTSLVEIKISVTKSANGMFVRHFSCIHRRKPGF